jgi:DNA/RNA-binding domain of Phe-tRNA-synthetase-like protein
MLEIEIKLDGVRLGVLEAAPVRVEPGSPDLAREVGAVCRDLERRLRVQDVAELEPLRNVRAMFRAWGVDASRYRPSAEALLRRIVQGKGLDLIANVVDIVNLGSIETGWPFGGYDRAAIHPPVSFRLGLPGETYEGIGKRVWHLADRPVLADALGPFGSPISDSTRTMVTEGAHSLLVVIFAPAAAESTGQGLPGALAELALRLQTWAGVERLETGMLGKSA